ncbi:MAG: bifunctional riboflavin kinase/FAD synthetase [Candidatus Auribacterota bacterium]|nr:bifunctional riboflavin kinase/FAD synthetase [Candidatus Auribacterota bacterium]
MISIYEFTEGAITRELPLVMACGFFDGVHKGHQAVLQAARAEAERNKGKAIALSFSPHPRSVLDPAQPVRLLTTENQKIRLFETYGLDGCVLLKFSRIIREMEPEEFIHLLREKFPHLREIVVGRNWRFGAGNRGDTELLEKCAAENHLNVTVVEPVLWQEEPISSTRVRQAVESGELEDIEFMLGRPFRVLGDVTHGLQLGRRLGFPTANIQPEDKLLPPPGSYATYVDIDRKTFLSATYIGHRPTFNGNGGEQFLEVFILDQDLHLYGKELEISFIKKIREEVKFDSPEELSKQIATDVEEARRILSG